jgi:bacteriocin-like protein
MENVMTKGFCELNENEMMNVDGGDEKDTQFGYYVGYGVGAWSNFWEGVGASAHQGVCNWNNYWQDKGSDLYNATH